MATKSFKSQGRDCSRAIVTEGHLCGWWDRKLPLWANLRTQHLFLENYPWQHPICSTRSVESHFKHFTHSWLIFLLDKDSNSKKNVRLDTLSLFQCDPAQDHTVHCIWLWLFSDASWRKAALGIFTLSSLCFSKAFQWSAVEDCGVVSSSQAHLVKNPFNHPLSFLLFTSFHGCECLCQLV